MAIILYGGGTTGTSGIERLLSTEAVATDLIIAGRGFIEAFELVCREIEVMPLREIFKRKKLAYGPVEPPPVVVNTIPRRSVRAVPLLMRLARSTLPMRWGTYQGAF